MQHIVYFTKYARNGASSRLRSYQYIDLLNQEPDIKVTVQNLFPEEYITKLYTNQSIKKIVFVSYLKRLVFLLAIFRFDKVVIEKELFPYLPAWTEIILNFFGIKYIVDYDDAIYHNYDRNPNRWVRKFLGNKIKKVIKCADSVIVGNTYLKNYALQAQAKKCFVVPTVLDINRYPEKEYSTKKELTIGWIGTPKTVDFIQGNLSDIENNELNFNWITVGGRLENTKKPYTFIPWSEDTEVQNIHKFDVGLMPLLDSDFEKGKCGYKLIQYMACGIPVIASAVGANNDIVAEGANGFLVKNKEDWTKHLSFFIENPDQIAHMGQIARKMVENKYTLQVQYPILKSILFK